MICKGSALLTRAASVCVCVCVQIYTPLITTCNGAMNSLVEQRLTQT